MKLKFIASGGFVLMLGLSPTTWAASISIADPGFEDPATGVSSAGQITGWVIAGSGAGVWNLNDSPTGFWTVLAPQGKQIVFVGREDPAGPASISQVLGDILLANSFYTLSGQVGHPRGFGASRGPDTIYTVELLAGTTVLSAISGTGPEGMFSSFQLTFDSTGSSLVGQALQIRLSSSQAQSGFDNIQLNVDPSSAAVPEPSLFLFTGAAISAILGYRWRESKRT